LWYDYRMFAVADAVLDPDRSGGHEATVFAALAVTIARPA
jgi:hypothetical protein